MSANSFLEILRDSLSLLLSLLPSAAIAALMSKIIAQKIADRDRLKQDRELAVLRSELESKGKREIEKLKHELDLMREQSRTYLSEKARIYLSFVELVADVLADFDNGPLDQSRLIQFNSKRLRLYGHLALFAPQSVMDAQDRLTDHLLYIINDPQRYDWSEIRSLALGLLNEMRNDLGFEPNKIIYNGVL